MPVAIVGTPTAVRYFDPTIDVEAGADYLVAAAFLGPGGLPPASTGEFDGAPMDLLAEAYQAGNRFAEIDVFGQVAPSEVADTVVLEGTGQSGGAAVALSGVDPVDPVADADQHVTDAGTAVSVTVNVPEGGRALCFLRWTGATEAVLTPGSGTTLEADSTWIEFGQFAVLARAGSGAQTFACTLSESCAFVAVALAFAPAPAGGPPPLPNVIVEFQPL